MSDVGERYRVVITRLLPGDPEARLRRAAGGHLGEVFAHTADEALDRGALLEAIGGATAVVTTPADRVDADFFEAAGPALRIVQPVLQP